VKNLFSTDISNIENALNWYIVEQEDILIKQNAGDKDWMELNTYKETLYNIKFLKEIYG